MKINEKPDIFDLNKLDEKIVVKNNDAINTQKIIAKDGLLLGMSSGAAIYAALEKAKKMKTGSIVVLSADGGEKYLSIS